MMTQPIQMFENLTSETSPAGGNVTKTGFMITNVVTDAILWVARPFSRGVAALKADFRLRAAEEQLFRMSDRELADLGLSRAEIPFAVRDSAVEGLAPAFAAQVAAPVVAANRNTGPNLFWAGRT